MLCLSACHHFLSLSVTPPGHFTNTGTGVTDLCPNGQYRAEWMPYAQAANCDVCGDLIQSEATDQITAIDIKNETESKVDVATTSAACCESQHSAARLAVFPACSASSSTSGNESVACQVAQPEAQAARGSGCTALCLVMRSPNQQPPCVYPSQVSHQHATLCCQLHLTDCLFAAGCLAASSPCASPQTSLPGKA